MDLTFLQWLDVRFVVVAALAVMAVIGLIGVITPRHFSAISRAGGRWIDTTHWWAALDKRIDVDHIAIRHSRVFGMLVFIAAAFLAWVYWTHVLGYPLPF